MSGGCADDAFAVGVRFLAGVSLERDGTAAIGVAVAEELPQLALLAVGQGVHRVDDDGLDASPATAAQDGVHDGHHVGEGLAASCPGGQDVGVAAARDADGLALVAVETKGTARALRVGLDAEDLAAFRMENAFSDEIVNRCARLEGRVELDERLGPQYPCPQLLVHEGVQPGLADLDEAARVGRIVLDHLATE